jgi:hypothetical protein
MKPISILLSIMVLCTLVACQPAEPQPVLTPSMEVTLIPSQIPSVTSLVPGGTDTETQPSVPGNNGEFSDLSAAQKAVRFPLWLPSFVPDELPFYKAWVSDRADGSEAVRVLYLEPGNPLDANLKGLSIWMTETNQPVTHDSITHQFKVTALDVREVQVRGQTGFAYWTQSNAGGNSAYLDWREGSINFSLSLSGAWPQPDENNPHGLDSTLLKIAGSLNSKP